MRFFRSDALSQGDYFIDVSAYQPADLTSICQQAGTDKAVIKLTEGDSYLSSAAEQQTKTSTALGYYSYAWFGGDTAQAKREADWLIKNMPKTDVKYLVCDYEEHASGDKQANTNAVLEFMGTCKQAGYTPILYTGIPYAVANLHLDQIVDKYPRALWIACYATMDYNPEYGTGDTAVLDKVLNQYSLTHIKQHIKQHIIWHQFSSTALPGGLDKNIVLN
ncbi:GH25 family lysozyme [Streptococcus chenjunshii]|uniref:GH25 family lysozyme n=1 Tax=Streptococcus chenjunshii TaxID=2173853 RepID=UPI0013C3763A|nr:GH25 family lysozyme [Streptococcus chenjunshii]